MKSQSSYRLSWRRQTEPSCGQVSNPPCHWWCQVSNLPRISRLPVLSIPKNEERQKKLVTEKCEKLRARIAVSGRPVWFSARSFCVFCLRGKLEFCTRQVRNLSHSPASDNMS